MSDTDPVVMGRSFAPPGKGPWELETTHAARAVTPFGQAAALEGFPKGFAEGTARYGVLLSHLAAGFSEGFQYNQPVPVGAPAGAMGLPPKPILQLVSRIHPEMRRRHKAAAHAIEVKLWRQDLAHWDEVDKPAAIAAHRSIQEVDLAALSDPDLADHVDRCARHVIDSAYLHHKYTIPACFPVGDFLAGAGEWTGASVGELMTLLRGRSTISRGFAAAELDAAAKALTTSDPARAILAAAREPETILAELMADPDVGADISAYVEAVRWRCVGYDVGDRAAGELPDVLVESLRATLAGSWAAAPDDDAALQELRERVPVEHRDEFDDRLAEVRLMYRLRDERGVYSDGWGVGLARRALLEAGRRLAARGLVLDPEHAVDLSAAEVRGLLLGNLSEPGADTVADRFAWRASVTTSEAPPFLRGMPPSPPPAEWLPAPARRTAAAINTFMGALFGVPETPNSDTVLHGLAVNTGVYEGPARLVESSEDFGRIQQGDVLVTRMTSPYFNVVLPLLGAIVTDRGGQLCHAAIVAREYGIPGIVGTRDATRIIQDGDRVRVDGTAGEVQLLG